MLTNIGNAQDCRQHLTVEVKLDEDGPAADWIKVQMATAPGP